MSRPADHIDNILAEARTYARALEPVKSGLITVHASGHLISLSLDTGRVDSPGKGKRVPVLLELRKALYEYLHGVFPSRKFLYTKRGGEKIWWSGYRGSYTLRPTALTCELKVAPEAGEE